MIGLRARVKDDEPWGEVPESETCWQQAPHRDTCWPVSGFVGENTEAAGGASLFSHVSSLAVVVVDVEDQSLPVESGELNWWPLSGPGPGIGEGSHSCGLYGWIALNGVGAL